MLLNPIYKNEVRKTTISNSGLIKNSKPFNNISKRVLKFVDKSLLKSKFETIILPLVYIDGFP